MAGCSFAAAATIAVASFAAASFAATAAGGAPGRPLPVRSSDCADADEQGASDAREARRLSEEADLCNHRRQAGGDRQPEDVARAAPRTSRQERHDRSRRWPAQSGIGGTRWRMIGGIQRRMIGGEHLQQVGCRDVDETHHRAEGCRCACE